LQTSGESSPGDVPVLVDASALFEAICGSSSNRRLFRDLFEAESAPRVSTEACLTEAMYLVHQQRGWSGQASLIAAIEAWSVDVRCLDRRWLLVRQLMHQYRDLPIDFADATLLIAAEDTAIRRVLTTDVKDFSVYRTLRGRPFEIVGLR
jgi:predicted nucleic acid-binding protein